MIYQFISGKTCSLALENVLSVALFEDLVHQLEFYFTDSNANFNIVSIQ